MTHIIRNTERPTRGTGNTGRAGHAGHAGALFPDTAPETPKRNTDGGYTLVELIVAGVILAVAFAAVFATVRFVRAQSTADYHRRQARMTINSIFEGAFNLHNFPGPYIVSYSLINPDSAAVSAIVDTIRIEPIGTLSDQTITRWPNVVIDKRASHNSGSSSSGALRQVRGTITARFRYELVPISVSGGSGSSSTFARNSETHLLTLKIKWPAGAPASEQDSIQLTRRLTKGVLQ